MTARSPLPEIAVGAAWEDVFAGGARAALEAALPRYLAGCRWFGGKARRVRAVRIADAVPVPLGGTSARIVLLEASYADGGRETYALPVAFAPAAPPEPRERAAAGIVRLRAGGARGLLHAADADPRFARAALDAMAEGRRFPGAAGDIVARGSPSLAAERARAGAEPVPMGAEQSNTSIRFGTRLVLKLFRRTEPGPNPEIEVGAFLTDVARFAGVPPVLGAAEYRPRAGEPIGLAVLQGFVANEGDAWTYTLRHVAAALERLAAAGVRPPAGPPAGARLVDLALSPPGEADRAVAGPYLEAAALLGRRTAELHLALSSHPEVPAFRPEPFSPGDARALRAAFRSHVEESFALLARRRRLLRPALRARAGAVLAREADLLERADALAERPPAAQRTRVHGDLHLGQVLFTGRDFVLIDFEGEPARPIASRREKASPLRDVAGMIRSFHYAAHQGAAARPHDGAGRRSVAEGWARLWYVSSAAAFLRAWLETARRAPFVPATRGELSDLLDLHLAEKAIYEIAYELNHRPEWVGLPLQGISDLLGAAEAKREARVAKGTRAGPRTEAARKAKVPPREKARPGEAPEAAARSRARPRVVPAGGPGDQDLHYFNEGTNHRAYRTMGAHPGVVDGVAGTSFAVWAPNAERVSVMGDFNDWDKERHQLWRLGDSGVWQGFVPAIGRGTVYKYHVRSRQHGYAVDKADPFGFFHEVPPRTGSVVWDLDYQWGDAEWMRTRGARNALSSPMSIYEVHLGSWRRVPEEGNRPLGYREIAPLLADYVADMGFTHVELLPVMEHPFYGSWGYQTTGYFAPTSRFGTPQDFMVLVDTLHQRGIGVLLDWVPSHFPTDAHGLSYFDGTHVFEHQDRRQGHHPDWDSYIFNYGRHEVRSFLLSSALFWLDRYHADGLRVDAVASMLYLDYSRREGQWIPNRFGGRENLDAISFLRRFNEVVYGEYPDVQTIAEESTAWAMVSRPVYVGGLGFGMKWDMGWMHDTLGYMRHDPVHRKYHHNEITFRMIYAFNENFVLPLSHDEVVHGKRSLLDQMPGDSWEKFANLRLLYGYMWGQPGKKLLFMGAEIAQGLEWSHERSLDWHLLGVAPHEGVRRWVRDLARLMREEPALHARDFDPSGFEWVDGADAENSVLSFLRKAGPDDPEILVVANFTPVARQSYRVGVPRGGMWEEALNGDAAVYGGRGFGNFGRVEASPVSAHGRPFSLTLTLPPLAALFLRSERRSGR